VRRTLRGPPETAVGVAHTVEEFLHEWRLVHALSIICDNLDLSLEPIGQAFGILFANLGAEFQI